MAMNCGEMEGNETGNEKKWWEMWQLYGLYVSNRLLDLLRRGRLCMKMYEESMNRWYPRDYWCSWEVTTRLSSPLLSTDLEFHGPFQVCGRSANRGEVECWSAKGDDDANELSESAELWQFAHGSKMKTVEAPRDVYTPITFLYLSHS